MIQPICERCKSNAAVFTRRFDKGRQSELVCKKCYAKLPIKCKWECRVITALY